MEMGYLSILYFGWWSTTKSWALMNDPKIILADEPTGNLDTKTGKDVFNLLTLLSREFKRTIIMVTHNPELAAATDRAIHIRDGPR